MLVPVSVICGPSGLPVGWIGMEFGFGFGSRLESTALLVCGVGVQRRHRERDARPAGVALEHLRALVARVGGVVRRHPDGAEAIRAVESL